MRQAPSTAGRQHKRCSEPASPSPQSGQAPWGLGLQWAGEPPVTSAHASTHACDPPASSALGQTFQRSAAEAGRHS
eukprot:1380464-Lingulodinium_polyedra.AAC.1